MLGNILFLTSADSFFKMNFFFKKSSRNINIVTNSLEPDQVRPLGRRQNQVVLRTQWHSQATDKTGEYPIRS